MAAIEDPEFVAARLIVDLDALAANYRTLRERLAPAARCAAVVKADAYGLGAAAVGPALWRVGCRVFFVAHGAEGIALRRHLPDAEIGVLHGPLPGEEAVLAAHRLIAVLNDLDQIARWRQAIGDSWRAAMLHIDTGMNRLGLAPSEAERLAAEPARLSGIELRGLISHLACAEDGKHPMNRQQHDRFIAWRARFPGLPASLANSSGIFLGPDYHFDLARPGVALYGVNPTPGRPNPMRQVIQLKGKMIGLREIDRTQTVGYGARFRADRPRRIATVAVGYADGYLRSLSETGFAAIAGVRVPLVGRVSMDLLTFDVSAVPASDLAVGAEVELIGPQVPIDALAERGGTIGYEVLTSLGARYRRDYLGDGTGAAA